MGLKPGMGRKSSSKNPPILSHEFVIQNHADIVSCVAMVFVVGLMLQATSSLANIFVALSHNISGVEPSQENPRGEQFFYEAGWKDGCAIFFYTLICIIMHAILQEYVLDKISKKLHLSKFKLSRFNESGQLVVFYAMSFLWGLDAIIRDGYFNQMSLLWQDFPNHPMGFLHKLFFIVQLAYYLHMLPELYFQRVKKEEQQSKIVHSIAGFALIGVAYLLNFQRIALVLLTLHYLSVLLSHVVQLVDIFDKDEKLGKLRIVDSIVFVVVRFATMVLAVLTLFFGMTAIESGAASTRGIIALLAIFGFQGYHIYNFISEYLRAKRERQNEQQRTKRGIAIRSAKNDAATAAGGKRNKQRESDLPEADQNTGAKLKAK